MALRQAVQAAIAEAATMLVRDAVGRAEHQGPEVDGVTLLAPDGLRIGDLVDVAVVDTDGVDLRGVVLDPVREPVAAR